MIYALTKRDVAWIGNAAHIAGGFVTTWDEEDNASPLPEIIKRKTGRYYLGTMPGIDAPVKIDTTEIIADAITEIDRRTSQHHIVLAGNRRTREWIDLIRSHA